MNADDAPDDDDAFGEHEDLVAAGLYDPDAADAAERLALLTYLADEIGASIPELVQAEEVGGLLSFAAVRSLRPEGERWTLSDVAAQVGIDTDFAAAIWRAAGFVDPRPFERRFDPSDVGVFELVRDLAALVGRDQSLQLVRTTGEAIARIAEAEIALLRSNIEAPLAAQGQFVDVARTYAAAANQLFPRITEVIDVLHRRQIELIGRRYSDVSAPHVGDERRGARSRIRRHRRLHRALAPARSVGARGDAGALRGDHRRRHRGRGRQRGQADRRRGDVRDQRSRRRVRARARADRGVHPRAAAEAARRAVASVR